MVRVNRAFALARAEGPASGLALLDAAEARQGGVRYPYAALVRGVLLAELGRLDEAELARNPYEIAEIEQRRAELRAEHLKTFVESASAPGEAAFDHLH